MLDGQVAVDLEAAYGVAGGRDAIRNRHAHQEQQQGSGDDRSRLRTAFFVPFLAENRVVEPTASNTDRSQSENSPLRQLERLKPAV